MKKTLYIIGTLILILVVAYGIYAFYTFNMTGEIPRPIDILPFGGVSPLRGLGGEEDMPSEDGDAPVPEDISQDTPSEIPRLRQWSEEPAAGYITFTKNVEGEEEEVVRYMERATGHVYEGSVNHTDLTRISNTTIPRIARAVWITEENLLVQYLDEGSDFVRTFSAALVPPEDESVEGELVGSFLPDNLEFAASSQGDGSILYGISENGAFRAIRSDPTGGSAATLFTSPLSEWDVEEAGDALALTTRPSRTALGYYYFKEGSLPLRKIMGGEDALMTLTSPDGTRALYSFRSGNRLISGVVDTESLERTVLSTATLPSKCVWGRESDTLVCGVPKTLPAGIPDSWHQGIARFEDDIWKINARAGTAELLLSPNAPLDMIDLSLNERENYLFFRDKYTQTLWSYAL